MQDTGPEEGLENATLSSKCHTSEHLQKNNCFSAYFKEIDIHVQWVLDYLNSDYPYAQLFEHSIIQMLKRRQVFDSSGKMFQALEFCCRRKQSCYMNDFSRMLQCLFSQYRI